MPFLRGKDPPGYLQYQSQHKEKKLSLSQMEGIKNHPKN
jgi:hypothetical protein